MLKPAYDLKKLKISLITVQDNTMLKHISYVPYVNLSLITVQDNTMLKLLYSL